ncbi:metal ABC transporter permease, partial [Vibrio parahaemolyticus]|nr:metal ABC transporter permease [Vibrio parahaemolyticus]
LRNAKISSIHKQIALVTQETVLFNDSIKYNISYGKPDATDEETREAARIAFAADFIEEFPNGYDTIVGERGTFLSGGQR